MATKQKSSLVSFVLKTASPVTNAPVRSDVAAGGSKKQTVRLTREQWLRVMKLGLEMDKSFQDLAIAGLSAQFVERGLPPL